MRGRLFLGLTKLVLAHRSMSDTSRIVKSDFKALNEFMKGIESKEVVKVGIFANRSTRQGNEPVGNPDLGAIHEFGSFAKHIPARSWLVMPLVDYAAEILKMASRGIEYHLSRGNFHQILLNLGIACENAIQRAFATSGFGTWAPNASSTIRAKGSDKPLIDTSQLRRSVTSKVGKPE